MPFLSLVLARSMWRKTYLGSAYLIVLFVRSAFSQAEKAQILDAQLRTCLFEDEVPGIVPCQADMFPVHWREMAHLLCGHLHSFTAQLLHGSC